MAKPERKENPGLVWAKPFLLFQQTVPLTFDCNFRKGAAVEAEAAGNAPALFPCSHSFPKQTSDLPSPNRNSLNFLGIWGLGSILVLWHHSQEEWDRQGLKADLKNEFIRGQDSIIPFHRKEHKAEPAHALLPLNSLLSSKIPHAPPSEELLPSALLVALAPHFPGSITGETGKKLSRNSPFPSQEETVSAIWNIYETLIVQALQTLWQDNTDVETLSQLTQPHLRFKRIWRRQRISLRKWKKTDARGRNCFYLKNLKFYLKNAFHHLHWETAREHTIVEPSWCFQNFNSPNKP